MKFNVNPRFNDGIRVWKALPMAALKTFIFGTLRIQRTQSSILGGVTGLLLSGYYNLVGIILFAFAILCFHLSANALNDIADIQSDRINAPERPLIQGIISKTQVGLVALLLFGLGLFLSFLVALELFILAVTLGVFWGLIYNYGLKLKDNPLGSLLYLSLGSGGVLTYLVGTFVGGNINPSSLVFSLYIMALGSSISIMVLKDYEGDKLSNKRTIAVALGPEKASKIVSMIIILPIALYWIPPIIFGLSNLYFFYIIPTLILRGFLGYRVWKPVGKDEARRYYAKDRVVRFWDFIAIILAAMSNGSSMRRIL